MLLSLVYLALRRLLQALALSGRDDLARAAPGRSHVEGRSLPNMLRLSSPAISSPWRPWG